jgi:predicted RNA binding protein YcfA (HicA-like mRNA interferase family)
MGLTLTRKQAIRMLEKIGATFEEGGRHHKVSLEVDGKKVFKTVLSHGSKDIPTGTARSIFRALGLAGSVEKCIALRDCPLQRDEYIAYLRSEGFL